MLKWIQQNAESIPAKNVGRKEKSSENYYQAYNVTHKKTPEKDFTTFTAYRDVEDSVNCSDTVKDADVNIP